MPDAAAARLMPAVLQERYRLGPVLGHGGESVVLRARDRLLGRDVAIKVFTARASGPADLIAQQAEARTLARLNHHGLVTLLDVGIDTTDPGAPQVYLVLELLEDADLGTRLRAGPLGPLDTAYIGFDLAGALGYIHRAGVIHCDIKPSNVLLAGAGTQRVRGKLADFGVALLRGTAALHRTTGSAAYLSPEQLRGEALTPASDVYSLGLVLLEALTGAPAPASVVGAALGRRDRGPRIPPSVPGPIAALLASMTARRAEDRPTPAAVEAALQRFLIDAIGGPAAGPDAREESRLAALHRYDLLDTPPDDALDRITALAARSTGCSVALIALIDAHRVWFKSRIGVAPAEVPRAGRAMLERTIVIEHVPPPVPGRPPMLASALGARFFAAAPLVTADGYAVGMLAVADGDSRTITPDGVAVLEDLAALVLHEMELRLAVRRAVTRR